MFARRTNWDLRTNAFSRAVQAAKEQGGALLDLTVSNPTDAGFRHDATILQALLDPAALQYDPQPRGLFNARQAVCDYYKEQRASIDPEQLFLTVSTSEAYSFAFRLLCDAGDNVISLSPSYPLFEFLTDIQDVELRRCAMSYESGWQIEFESLQSAMDEKTRAILIVNPNNPTGSFIDPEEKAALNEICARRGLALIVDEVFLDFPLEKSAGESFAGNPGALTFTLSGISKIAALPQMKLAWMAVSGPEELTRAALARLEVIADTYLSVPAATQLALPAFMAAGKTMRAAVLERLRHNLKELDDQLTAHPSCSRLRAEAGWYAVLRVPATRSDEELAVAILEQAHVVAHPGHFFDFQRDGYLVFSLLTEPKVFEEGCSRILQFCDKA